MIILLLYNDFKVSASRKLHRAFLKHSFSPATVTFFIFDYLAASMLRAFIVKINCVEKCVITIFRKNTTSNVKTEKYENTKKCINDAVFKEVRRLRSKQPCVYLF